MSDTNSTKPQDKLTTIQLIEYIMGYVQDGSDTSITLSQDNTTQRFLVTINHNSTHKEIFYGRDLYEAIDRAVFG